MITSVQIISIIMSLAPLLGVSPQVAVAVATVESNLNPNAIGGQGEIGLFQIMPNLVKSTGFTKKQLLNPIINAYVGIKMIKHAEQACIHRHNVDFLVCYNAGVKNARKIKYPHKFPYVVKIKRELAKINERLASYERD